MGLLFTNWSMVLLFILIFDQSNLDGQIGLIDVENQKAIY